MIIGIDFDNTLVCYDGLFQRAALDQQLIPATLPPNKNAVRDYLRRVGREDDWTQLQGVVYGPRLKEAAAFPGALAFLQSATKAGHEAFIVSHKTQFPYRGEPHDLHLAARSWVAANCPAIPAYFEPTLPGKLARIAELHCDIFIDDLPEVLTHPEFPQTTQPVLFDPAGAFLPEGPVARIQSWNAALPLLNQSAQ